MHLIRRLLFAAGCLLFGLLVSLVSDPPKGSPVPARRLLHDVHPLLAQSGEGLWTFLWVMFAHPIPFTVVYTVLMLPWLVAMLIATLPRRIHKDPQRLFTVDQRRSGGFRAGDRCEMEGIFLTRCRRPGEHGDHWFPHSKGGGTTMENFVWACARCNIAKSARVPTFWETTRLEWRRRRYFDHAHTLRPTRRARAF